jgi:hypothetical protein
MLKSYHLVHKNCRCFTGDKEHTYDFLSYINQSETPALVNLIVIHSSFVPRILVYFLFLGNFCVNRRLKFREIQLILYSVTLRKSKYFHTRKASVYKWDITCLACTELIWCFKCCLRLCYSFLFTLLCFSFRKVTYEILPCQLVSWSHLHCAVAPVLPELCAFM